MKKLFAMVAAAGMLFVTSCAKDAAESYAEGNDGVVTFTLALENGAGTRTVSDGQSAKDLYYAVYNVSAGVFVPGYTLTTEANTFVDKETTVTFRLVKGQTYKAVFWAQSADAEAFTLEQTANDITMTFDYEGVKNNNEALDAFFAAYDFTLSQSGLNQTITLHRPFAQINLATTKEDYDAAVNQGFTPATSEVVLTNAATTLSLFDGSVTGETEATFAMNDIIDEQLTGVDADGDGVAEEYQYLSMCYVLVPQEKTTLGELSFTVRAEETTAVDVVVSDGLNSVPVQRNWRTNIVGNILLATADFTIIIDEQFDGDYNNWYDDDEWTATLPAGVEYDTDTQTITISNVEGLKWLSDATNGVYEQGLYPELDPNNKITNDYAFKKYVLAEGTYDLSAYNPWTPIKMAGYDEFDGQNAVIENLTVRATEGNGAAFINGFTSTVSNLTIKNVDIESNYNAAAVVCASYASVYNCHVDGGTITSTPWEKSNGVYDDGNNVGGIVPFWNGDAHGHTIEGCSVKNLTIKAFRKVGGIIGFDAVTSGTLNTVKNCTVENVTVIADMLETRYDGYAGRVPDAGKIVGNESNGAATQELSTNTADENTTVEVWSLTVSTKEALGGIAKAVANGNTFKGQTITLTEDIDLDGVEWTPIGSSSNKFQGVFDGGGKTISNLYVNRPANSYSGLFGYATEGEIKNVVIENATVIGYNAVGIIAGCPYTAKVSDITIKGKIKVEGGGYVGGALGYNTYGALTNIKIEAEEGSYVKAISIENGKRYRTYVGGIVGFPGEGNRTHSGLVSNIDVYGDVQDIGGITGIAHYGNTFENCTCSGNVYVTEATSNNGGSIKEIGGIAGVWNNGGNVTFKNCKFTGTLNSNLEPAEGWDAWREKHKITGDAYSASGTGILTIDDVDVTADHK